MGVSPAAAETKTCPECGGPLRAIRILECSGLSVPQEHTELRYTSVDTKKRVLSGRFPVEGRVRGRLCDSCGRILLYAVPEEK
jgi:hypothetical protein